MAIYLNGNKEDVAENMSIMQLLEQKKIRPEVVTVELNNQIVNRTAYKDTFLKDDDRVEFVYFMGGGTGKE